MRVSELAEIAEDLVRDGRSEEPIAAFLMTAERVRAIVENPALSDQEVSEILHDLQVNWGNPPIDDQLVEGVVTLHSLGYGP